VCSPRAGAPPNPTSVSLGVEGPPRRRRTRLSRTLYLSKRIPLQLRTAWLRWKRNVASNINQSVDGEYVIRSRLSRTQVPGAFSGYARLTLRTPPVRGWFPRPGAPAVASVSPRAGCGLEEPSVWLAMVAFEDAPGKGRSPRRPIAARVCIDTNGFEPRLRRRFGSVLRYVPGFHLLLTLSPHK